MRFCLFCRDSFDDDPDRCPTCGGQLVDTVPDDTDEPPAPRPHDPTVDESFQGALVPLVLVRTEDDLRAAVAVLSEFGIYFEIDSNPDALSRLYPVVPSRAWQILVRDSDGPEAFLRLVKALPSIFPAEVAEAVRADSASDDPASLAAERVVELLSPEADQSSDVGARRAVPAVSSSDSSIPVDANQPSDVGARRAVPDASSSDSSIPPEADHSSDVGARRAVPGLVESIILAFSSDDPDSVAVAKSALAKKGAPIAPLLTQIAATAVAEGGEGAERVLFHTLEVLEALGDDALLPKLAPLLSAAASAVRARAAYAAGRLGAPLAVDLLLPLLEDHDEDVRYEANEAIWRLSGLDFDFDPYQSIETQQPNIAALKDAWESSPTTGRVRNRTTLQDILRILADNGD
jgi:hypothetical protein